MIFKSSGNVKDLLQPLFVTLEPLNYSNKIKKIQNVFRILCFRASEPWETGVRKRNVPTKHRDCSQRLLKVWIMESIYWKHEIKFWYFHSPKWIHWISLENHELDTLIFFISAEGIRSICKGWDIGLGNWAPGAGGTSWRDPGDTLRPGLVCLLIKELCESPLG